MESRQRAPLLFEGKPKVRQIQVTVYFRSYIEKNAEIWQEKESNVSYVS
jgi:hypothetical protein